MTPVKTANEVLEIAKQERVRFLRLQFTDILECIKNVEIPEHQFECALEGQVVFDGLAIDGFFRLEESDMILWPDPAIPIYALRLCLQREWISSSRAAQISGTITSPLSTELLPPNPQGIPEGRRNYSRGITLLVYAWRKGLGSLTTDWPLLFDPFEKS